MYNITMKNGLVLYAQFIKSYGIRKLFLCQDRLVLTDLEDNEINSMDIIDFVML